ncbi:hypothetical protein [Thiothrix sp.]|jgi:hypothetical protein|uniref:hypothetical protein n=1 Tax=Thiothrix sp. TaxID=1032 RepID=UPI00257A58FF|nr:hypothetical protein [Thiothrix sp.]
MSELAIEGKTFDSESDLIEWASWELDTVARSLRMVGCVVGGCPVGSDAVIRNEDLDGFLTLLEGVTERARKGLDLLSSCAINRENAGAIGREPVSEMAAKLESADQVGEAVKRVLRGFVQDLMGEG